MDQQSTADIVPNLDAVARQAFEVLAGMIPEFPARNQLPGPFQVGASVSYKGDQQAPNRLVVYANSQFAVDFSERFLSLPARTLIDEDVLDAMGELANTVGGNFKGLLRADTTLSTPVVTKNNEDAEFHQSGFSLAKLIYTFPGDGQCLVELLGPTHE